MNVVLGLVVVMSLFAPPQTRQIQWASPTQGEAFAYGPHPACMSGGWGSGKTFVGCLKGIYLSTEYPKNRGVIARHVGRELRETTMATFFKVCPPHLYDRRKGGRRNDQNGYVKLADSQSEILFLHLDDPETAGIIRGLEINWFLIDQAEENPEHMEELYDLLCGRLGRWDIAEVPQWRIDREEAATGKPWPFVHPESGKAVPPPYPMLACNPDVETHWIYRRFHPESAEHHEIYAPQGYKMFHMPSEENKFLGDTNRKFLLAHDTAFIRRNVLGLWGQPEGAIHVVSPLSVIPGTPELLTYFQQYCTLFRTFDYGDSAPTCCTWWAVDRNGNCFAFREYYLPNAMISTHRGNISGLSEYEHYEVDLADPSIFHQMPAKQGGRFCIADEYCMHPDTKILTADLRHVRAGDIKPGDALAGFDEDTKSRPKRRWRRAIVESTATIRRPSYRLTFADGTVVVSSAEHRWLAYGGRWRRTEQLQIGQTVQKAVDVWDDDVSRDAGYLAAAFDGEGFLTRRGSTRRLGFSQRDNKMLTEVSRILDTRGIPYGLAERPINAGRGLIWHVTISRGADIMRVLGTTRPTRLLPAFDFDAWGTVSARPLAIVRKEFLGDTEVVAFKTSTRTCIAEGLMSHNCDVVDQPRETAIFWQPADNNELGTRNRINEYLRVDPERIHPITREPGSPRLFFVTRQDDYPQGIVHVLRQVRSQRRVKIGTDLGKPIFSDERDPDIVDHAYDTTRYFIASRPPAPPAEALIVEGTFSGARKLAAQHRKRMGRRA